MSSSQAMLDAHSVKLEVGDRIKLFIADETNINRDNYNSKVNQTVNFIEVIAFPIRFNPSQKFLEKVGFTEIFDVTFHLSKYEFNILQIDFQSIDVGRSYIEYKGVEYLIKEKSLNSQYGNDFLHIVVGCHKK
jgi:hypothetical protein